MASVLEPLEASRIGIVFLDACRNSSADAGLGITARTVSLGKVKRRNGILNNELYIGQIVHNRQRFLKDPATGKRISRENPEREWHRQAAPELRIIDDRTWEAVQRRRAERARQVGRCLRGSATTRGPTTNGRSDLSTL